MANGAGLRTSEDLGRVVVGNVMNAVLTALVYFNLTSEMEKRCESAESHTIGAIPR